MSLRARTILAVIWLLLCIFNVSTLVQAFRNDNPEIGVFTLILAVFSGYMAYRITFKDDEWTP